MKTNVKRLALPIVMVLLSLGSFAATPGVTLLFSNGLKASFAFASKPRIVVTADAVSISSYCTSAVSYSFADVQRFYFEDDVVETGISQIEGASSAMHPVFNYVDGVVTVSGMASSENLTIVNLNGSRVSAAKADGVGNASINLCNAPIGVYIVRTGNGVSFKLLKK